MNTHPEWFEPVTRDFGIAPKAAATSLRSFLLVQPNEAPADLRERLLAEQVKERTNLFFRMDFPPRVRSQIESGGNLFDIVNGMDMTFCTLRL